MEIKELITDKEHTQVKYVITKKNDKYGDFRLHHNVLFDSEEDAENTIESWAFINRQNYGIDRIKITGCDIGEEVTRTTDFVLLMVNDDNFKIRRVDNWFGSKEVIRFNGKMTHHALDLNEFKDALFMTSTLFDKLFEIKLKVKL